MTAPCRRCGTPKSIDSYCGSQRCGALLEIPASELCPGDRVSFGDHTGWLRVRSVLLLHAPTAAIEDRVRLVFWPRRFNRRIEWAPYRLAFPDETVWVQR